MWYMLDVVKHTLGTWSFQLLSCYSTGKPSSPMIHFYNPSFHSIQSLFHTPPHPHPQPCQNCQQNFQTLFSCVARDIFQMIDIASIWTLPLIISVRFKSGGRARGGGGLTGQPTAVDMRRNASKWYDFSLVQEIPRLV